MGCTTSKLGNEETVRRCKERRRLMKNAVYARHHLAAAHSDYFRSLRLTGSALCTFAAGEPLSVSDNTPSVFLNRVSPPSAAETSSERPHIMSSSNITTTNRRRKPPPELPHILPESSPCSSPRSQSSKHQAHDTTSQTSSVWNWENFYPPPTPPGSDYFRHRSQPQNQNPKTPNSESESEYNLFHSKPQHNHNYENENADSRQQQQHRHHHLNHDGFDSERSETEHGLGFQKEHMETERDEVRRSEWEDHCSSTSSSEEEEGIADYGSAARSEPVPAAKDEKEVMVVRHKDLKEIVEAIRDNFEKAAVAGDQLSEMLEISRAHLDRSFTQLRSKLCRFLDSVWLLRKCGKILN